MWKIILIILPVILILFAVVVALRPADFRVTRSATIAAPPAAVFAQVNNLRNWEAWSPWAKMDPNAKQTYTGPPAGVGASFAWAGNFNVGVGRMTITASRPDELVKFNLDFEKPMKGSNVAEFTFKPEGDRTAVTWSMSGRNNFIAKAFGLLVNCDKMIGGQFEKGLASLAAVATSPAKK